MKNNVDLRIMKVLAVTNILWFAKTPTNEKVGATGFEPALMFAEPKCSQSIRTPLNPIQTSALYTVV